MPRNAPTSFQVRAELLRRHELTLTGWAKKKGYPPASVQKAVTRYAGRNEPALPWGRVTRQILTDLAADTGLVLVPGLVPVQHRKAG